MRRRVVEGSGKIANAIALPIPRAVWYSRESMTPLNNAHPLAFHETVETPEQVQLHLELAGLGTRAIAFILDALIRYGLLVSTLVAAGMLSDVIFLDFKTSSRKTLVILFVLLLFTVEWLYYVMFEWLWNGQTPGKRAIRIRVLKDGGGSISFLDAALRNLLRPIDSTGPMCSIGMLFIFFNSRHKRPGDLVAQTIVVRERKISMAQVLSPPSVLTSTPQASRFTPLIQHIALNTAEHEMINRYLHRRQHLDPVARQRVCHQITSTILGKVRGGPSESQFELPTEPDYDQFLEELLAYHAGHSERPQ